MDYDQFLKLVAGRRSIRKLKSDPIPDGHIEKLVEAARWAPSGGNTQPWEFIAVRKPELKAAITEAVEAARRQAMADSGSQYVSSAAYASAPLFMLFFGDTRLKELGPPPVRMASPARWQSILTSSLAIAYQYMALAAVTLGLGSCWVSAVMHPLAEPRIRELLGVPDYMQIYDMMAVGYPDMEPAPKPLREVSDMLHFDVCGEADFRTVEQIGKLFG
jgi:nitroreductase